MRWQDLVECLSDISPLGSEGQTSLEDVRIVVTKLKKWLSSSEYREGHLADATMTFDNKAAKQRIQTSLDKLLSYVDVIPFDIRLECGCFALAILQEIQHQMDVESSRLLSHGKIDEGITIKRQQKTYVPPAPSNLISIQQTKVVEDTFRVVMYTAILACLDTEASLYVKITLAKTKFVLGPDLVAIPQSCQHDLLAAIMKIVLPIMKHESLGVGLQRSLFPEILSSMLELCFAPMEVKSYPEDAAFFRLQMEGLLTTMDKSLTVRHLLLLMGIVEGGVWLKKGCRSLIVRRFLMKPGGIEAVLLAGLSICDGQDWQCCEAVAEIIAQAKTGDISLLFAKLGPQLWELINQDGVKPEVFRVLSLVVSKLAERSSKLTALHITTKLLQPLLDTTYPDAVRLCENSNLTMCISRVHKLFMEISPPSAALTSLLQPVLKPLMSVATLATTHLRTLARQLIVWYLSQLSQDDVVENLLVLSNLKTSVDSPPLNPEIEFSVDDDGGVKVNKQTELEKDVVWEDDENLSLCIISILEMLKNSAVVLEFYEKLALCIDFATLNRKGAHSSVLLTHEDLKADQLEALRIIIIACSHLKHLSESEQVTNDLFINLSDAVPFVNSLIKVSCQKCEHEHLNQIQISLATNILMLVFYYVSERSLRKKMSREDWMGLKDILPSLEKVTQSKNDEYIILFVEQLKNLVLTHGVIEETTVPNDTTNVENHKIRNSAVLNIRMTNTKESNVDACVKGNACSNNENAQQSINASTFVKNSWDNSSYKKSMEDLFSPLLPIRGHALLSLGKLIEERDEETMSHKEQLLLIFQQNLKEEDSYLYLMAVQGLVVLGDAFPDKVVETLTQEFSIGNHNVEDRAKLAEALTRTTRHLGALLPHYKHLFINTFLTGVKDQEAIVRAASLSALGDVCRLLRFSLGPVVHEIFDVLYHVVKSDEAKEVRRAALLVVTLLLQGLDSDAITVLQVVMRDLYRALRLIHVTDADDVVRLHAQLAIAEIDTITRQFLLPKLNLTKRIYVTDVPPNTF